MPLVGLLPPVPSFSAHSNHAFCLPWPLRHPCPCRQRLRLYGADTHPNTGHSGDFARCRCVGQRPYWFGQNCRVCPACLATTPKSAASAPPQWRCSPRAYLGGGTHARAGGPSGRGAAQFGPTPITTAQSGGGVWWRIHQPADDGLARWCRHRCGHTGALAGPHRGQKLRLGRLLDLVDQRALRLSAVQLLVLDEADRLLDLGFSEELNRVLGLLPAQRQTLLFSATFPDSVQTLANGLLRSPVRIEVAASEDDAHTNATILQRAIAVDDKRRTQLLLKLIKDEGWDRVLVFVATKYTAEHVAEKLYRAKVFATPFHGDLSQGARTQVLDEFKASRWQVVVTTDLAARGIDIAQLPVVVNYDLPRSTEDYTHRIGRTGRAGESGLAVTFVTPASQAHWQLIEKRQHLSLPLEHIDGFEPTEVAPAPSPNNGGIKGKRPSKKDKLRAAQAANAQSSPK